MINIKRTVNRLGIQTLVLREITATHHGEKTWRQAASDIVDILAEQFAVDLEHDPNTPSWRPSDRIR